MTKLTIGLPVYNSEALIRESIESLLSQTYGDLVLQISDNASTDASGSICTEYVSLDERVRYTRNSKNIGLSANYNLLVDRCETPYFKWAAADDLWDPTMVEKTMAVIESDPSIAVCYPKTKLVNLDAGFEEKYDDNLHMMQSNPADRFLTVIENLRLVNLPYGISRLEALRKTSMLKSFPGADLIFVAELAIYGKFYEFPEYLFIRRFHRDSSSWAPNDKDHQKERFHAAGAGNVTMLNWRAQIEFFRAAMRAPFPLPDRMRVLRILLRNLRWRRSDLGHELVEKLKGLVPGTA